MMSAHVWLAVPRPFLPLISHLCLHTQLLHIHRSDHLVVRAKVFPVQTDKLACALIDVETRDRLRKLTGTSLRGCHPLYKVH